MGYFLHVVKRIPLVFTVHERFSFSLLLNRLYTKATKVIAISPELKKKIQTYGVHEDKLIVIPNMVDTDVFSPIVADPNSIVSSPAHSFKLLSAGRLDLSKELLIITVMELMPRIVSVIPKTQLLVIGGGPRIEHLKDIASKINHQVGKDIIFVLGRVHNLVKFLREADMVIGVGRVAIEAMSCGKPVIVASNNGGFVFSGALVTKENALELSKSNFSGRGYCEKMDPERFYKVILELLVNEKYRKRVGIEGRAFVKKNLDALVITKRTLSVYLECLNVR
jgi:glycosyltransferase involved in cell wall biosynthesis